MVKFTPGSFGSKEGQRESPRDARPVPAAPLGAGARPCPVPVSAMPRPFPCPGPAPALSLPRPGPGRLPASPAALCVTAATGGSCGGTGPGAAGLRGSYRGHSGSGGGRSGAESTAGNGRGGGGRGSPEGAVRAPVPSGARQGAKAVSVLVSPQVSISCGSITSGAWSFFSQCPSGSVTPSACSLWSQGSVPCVIAHTSEGTRALESPTALPHEESGLFHAPPSPIMVMLAGRRAPHPRVLLDVQNRAGLSNNIVLIFLARLSEGCVSPTASGRQGSDQSIGVRNCV